MNGTSVLNLDLIDRPIALVGCEEPGFLDSRYWTTDRTADVGDVEVWIGISGLQCVGNEIGFGVQVIKLPGGKSGILVVVEREP